MKVKEVKRVWNRTWNKYGWIVLAILSFIFLLIAYAFKKNKTGTFSNIFFLPYKVLFKNKNFRPKESKGEIECRKILEDIFGEKFPKVRPNFLKHPATGKNLEIDCYNEKRKLGLEYSGRQHYVFTPVFHKTLKDFEDQKERDELKKKLCQENGVKLIEVPYTVKHEDLETFIKQELKRIYGLN